MPVRIAVLGEYYRRPTPKQLREMAQRRAALLAEAKDALAAGDDDRAFDLDVEADDIAENLYRFGCDIETGRPKSKRNK